MAEEEEQDERVLDWWSKYFASIETMMEVKNKIKSFFFLSMEFFYPQAKKKCVEILIVLFHIASACPRSSFGRGRRARGHGDCCGSGW